MKALAGIVLTAGILLGGYYYYLKSLPTPGSGTAATQVISLTGVKTDLLQVAQAERNYVALNGKCGSLDELISGGTLTMTAAGRDGYTYAVECAGVEFRVVAEHAAAPAGSPIRYPILAVDQSMQVAEVR